jgi:hypothetical protein
MPMNHKHRVHHRQDQGSTHAGQDLQDQVIPSHLMAASEQQVAISSGISLPHALGDGQENFSLY